MFKQEKLMKFKRKFKYRWYHFFNGVLVGLGVGLCNIFLKNNPVLMVLFSALIGAILGTIGTIIRVKVNDYLK